MNNTIKNKIKQKNGITLIALVITIIVLLILAGVSIAMLTGQNGILTQANNAKDETEQANAKEKVESAVIATMSQSKRGTLDADKLVTEITNSYGGTATKTGTGFPVNTTVDGKSFTVDGNGNVTSTGSENGPTERKLLSEITGNETANTPAKDNLDNPITIPAGFEVVNPNDNVEDGIVVRDKTHTKTAGSEFVWIPVGDVKTRDKGTINIELNRYTFDRNGKETKQGTNKIDNCYTEDTAAKHDKNYENTIAKDIEDFKSKAEGSHGYYIGRYEARTANERSGSTTDDKLTQITTKPNDYVYTWVTQQQAAKLSREMYTKTPFESDLINSYAWDTATLFLQTIDNRTTDKSEKYSLQYSLNSGLASQGTNNLTEASKIDKICNVYDMASNCCECSTETYSYSDFPCAIRGGYYYGNAFYTSNRNSDSATDSGDDRYSFRPLLYL